MKEAVCGVLGGVVTRPECLVKNNHMCVCEVHIFFKVRVTCTNPEHENSNMEGSAYVQYPSKVKRHTQAVFIIDLETAYLVQIR